MSIRAFYSTRVKTTSWKCKWTIQTVESIPARTTLLTSQARVASITSPMKSYTSLCQSTTTTCLEDLLMKPSKALAFVILAKVCSLLRQSLPITLISTTNRCLNRTAHLIFINFTCSKPCNPYSMSNRWKFHLNRMWVWDMCISPNLDSLRPRKRPSSLTLTRPSSIVSMT